jgi:hypothetical protein
LPDDRRPSASELLDFRLSALEQGHRELRMLVEGQEPWSHRRRLHALENNDRAAVLAAKALEAHHNARNNRTTRVREWGGFALAAAALVLAYFH